MRRMRLARCRAERRAFAGRDAEALDAGHGRADLRAAVSKKALGAAAAHNGEQMSPAAHRRGLARLPECLTDTGADRVHFAKQYSPLSVGSPGNIFGFSQFARTQQKNPRIITI